MKFDKLFEEIKSYIAPVKIRVMYENGEEGTLSINGVEKIEVVYGESVVLIKKDRIAIGNK